ncbi:MAG: hypothetical protein EXQ63_05305 [Ilumatobacteraceae bacterium]|nr:hypothetical protein [Ilumatobacteraceae bacterium]
MTTPSDNTPESSDFSAESSDFASERAALEALRSVPLATDEMRDAHISAALDAFTTTARRRPPQWLSIAAASVVLVAGGGLAGRALSSGSRDPKQQITRNTTLATTIAPAPALAACMMTMNDATYISTTIVNGVEIALFLNTDNSLLAVRINDCAEVGSLDISGTAP